MTVATDAAGPIGLPLEIEASAGHEPRTELVRALLLGYKDRLWRVGGHVHWRADDGSLQRYSKEEFRSLVPSVAVFQGKRGPIDVPNNVIDNVFHQRTASDFPSIAGVRHCPWVDDHGRLVVDPGFDEDTGIWLHWQEEPCDPYSVSVEEIDDTLARLTDFQFASEADRMNLIGLFVQAVRHRYGSPSPMGVVWAADPEVAKSYVARLLGLVILGTEPGSVPLPPEHEMHYSLHTYIRAGRSLLWMDNAATGATVGGATLHQLLTAHGRVESRAVRTSDLASGDPTRAQWLVTGNQLEFDAELARRIVSIQLRLRKAGRGFLTPDLGRWVLENRRLVVSVLLRIALDWHDAGCPPPPKVLPSFEHWSRLVGGPVSLLPSGGHWMSASVVTGLDQEIVQLFEAWPEGRAAPERLPAAKVLALVERKGLDKVARLAGPGSDKIRQTAFGIWLTGLAKRERPLFGWFLRRRSVNGIRVYFPEQVGPQGGHPPQAKAALHTPNTGPSGPSGGGTPLYMGESDLSSSGRAEGGEGDPYVHPPRDPEGHDATFPGGPPPPPLPPSPSEVHLPPDDPALAAVIRMALRGVRVDPMEWLARSEEAETALVLADTREDRDRRRNLLSYSGEIYAQATQGRVRCSWDLQGPGRIGTVRPALQQVTKAFGLRGAVIPEAGHVFVCGDWSTAHVWIAAGLSRSRKLLDHAVSGDLYTRAAQVFCPELGDEGRAAAKVCVLSTLNGAGAGLAETLAKFGVTVDARTAGERRTAFLEGYGQLRTWLAQVEERREWVSPLGRAIRLPDDREAYTAVGWTLQAVEADALRLVLNRITHPVVLTNHDEVVLEVPEEEAERALLDLRVEMDVALLEVANLPRGEDITTAKVEQRGAWGKRS